MSDTLNKRIYLKASKEDVWAYLTDPEKLAIWFHKPTETLKKGQAYEMYGVTSGERVIWGEVTDANPFDSLEYTFSVAPMGDNVSKVRWTLSEAEDGTRLDLEHSDLPQGAEAFGLTLAFDKGWDDHLGRMREDIHAE